jgi:hypothetical protein
MPTFTIDPENNVTVFGSLQEISENGNGTETFSSAEELAALAIQWLGMRLVQIWNSLLGGQPVERFTSRQVAVKRIWKAIQHLQPDGGAHPRRVAASRVVRRRRPAAKHSQLCAKTARRRE